MPDTGSKGSATFSTYTGDRAAQPRVAGAGEVLPVVDKMRIERSGTQRWLVVSGIAPNKLWPTVKEFLAGSWLYREPRVAGGWRNGD